MSEEILSKIKENQSLEGLNVLIWGMGVTGKSLYKVCQDYGATVWNTDLKYAGYDKFIAQSEIIESNIKFDLIFKSPGVPWLAELNYFKSTGLPILGEFELVSLLSNIPIIAITGSNGKTTVCSMLKKAFDLLEVDVFLGGNIGHPYSKILKEKFEYAIVEASSFQLELIKTFAPLVGVVLNIVEHHQERHPNLDHYEKAKFNIFKNMNELCHLIIPEELKTKIKGEFKVSTPKVDRDYSQMKVVGEHNIKNFQFVEEILNVLGFDTAVMESLIPSFTGVEHRIEFIGKYQGSSIYNDSKSTNINSTLIAIKSFEDKSKIKLLLGGKLRSDDVEEFREIKKYLADEQILLFGESKKLLSKIFKSVQADSFEDFFQKNLDYPEIILFSPGFPSYDQFRNYEERGKTFKELMKSLEK